MRPDATDDQIDAIVSRLEGMRLTAHVSRGAERTVVGVVGITNDKDTLLAQFSQLDAVASVVPITHSYKLVSGEGRAATVVRLPNGATFGGETLAICAGPCSVESREQLMQTATAVARHGANVLRGGAFKPRTSPYAFQGLGEEGLKLLREAPDHTGLASSPKCSTSATSSWWRSTPTCSRSARVTCRISRCCGRSASAVAGPAQARLVGDIEEWLMAAEYIVVAGNQQVVLCERGIRTFENQTRNMLDLAAVPVLKRTHALAGHRRSRRTGRARRLVAPMAGGDRRRRRRPDHRGPPEPGRGAVRRTAVADARPLRRADGEGGGRRRSGRPPAPRVASAV